MKKLKKERSITNKVKQVKQPTDLRDSHPSKKNLIPKKQNHSHKQNQSMLQDKSFFLKAPKKLNQRSKTRSKSLLYDRRQIDASLEQINRYTLMDILQKKIDKADTDISAHINSIKYDRTILETDKVYSNCLSPHYRQDQRDFFSENKEGNDTTPKLKLLQQENETLRTNLTTIKDEMNSFKKENQLAKYENEVLKGKITQFECEAQNQLSALRQREEILVQAHRAQRYKLQRKVDDIQSQQDRLIEQRTVLQTVVRNQQQNISILQRQKQQSQAQCQLQRKEKILLRKEREEAKIRIESLQQQLHFFQGNLQQFQQIKQTYQQKLTQLEKEKQKIKRNAFQLLQIVQSYRQE